MNDVEGVDGEMSVNDFIEDQWTLYDQSGWPEVQGTSFYNCMEKEIYGL